MNEQKLLERRANCSIWAHLFFWFFIPLLGGLISSYKMRFMTPVYIILAVFCFGMTTYQPSSSTENEFVNVYQHGIKYRFMANVVGSILVVHKIRKSRKKLSTGWQFLTLDNSVETVQPTFLTQIEPSSLSSEVESISLSTKLDQFSIDPQLKCAQDLWKQAKMFETIISLERNNSQLE
jgi:hypothetical protein